MNKTKTAFLRIQTSVAAFLVSIPAFADTDTTSGLCDLITKLKGVFGTLRTLAFVGAGFILAKYAWEAITSGKINQKDNMVEGVKSVGVPMIIGFTLLFSIGVVLSALLSGRLVGCANELTTW